MIKKFNDLVDWFEQPSHIAGIAIFLAILAGGHYLIATFVGTANAGSDMGVALFGFLTFQTVERASSHKDWRFWVWLVAGGVLSFVLGAMFWSLARQD